jgi:hypothetical protein
MQTVRPHLKVGNMSAQDKLNAKVQYYMLQLLIIITRRLLYKDVSQEQDRKDLFSLQDASNFVNEFYG